MNASERDNVGGPSARSGRLRGRRLLVTGAASGIGRAVAQAFVREGAQVVATDVNADGLADVAAIGGMKPIPADLTDDEQISTMVTAAANHLGGLDGIANCAGIAPRGRVGEVAREVWTNALAVNLTAPYLIVEAALPWLTSSSESSIVNVASGVGILPDSPATTAYASSKGGLIALTKALASELAPTVRVNAVCPGIVRTPMTAAYLESPDGEPPAMLQRYAMKRAADPTEIAAAIVFLTSSEASFVTGSSLVVDGGRIFH